MKLHIALANLALIGRNQPVLGSYVKLRDAHIFNGKHNDITLFLYEVKYIIEFHLPSFSNDHSKVLYFGLHLKDGLFIKWFNHLEHNNSLLLYNWNNFLLTFYKKFSDYSLVQNAKLKLDTLKQTESAYYYLMAFMELARHLNMTEQTKSHDL